jgi:hypothetical protein
MPKSTEDLISLVDDTGMREIGTPGQRYAIGPMGMQRLGDSGCSGGLDPEAADMLVGSPRSRR